MIAIILKVIFSIVLVFAGLAWGFGWFYASAITTETGIANRATKICWLVATLGVLPIAGAAYLFFGG